MTREEFIERINEIMCGTSNAERACLEELYDEVTKPHWISVHEELPKDGQHTATINKVGVQDVRHYSRGKWYSNFGNEYDDIIHWMPLPEAPTVAKNATVNEKGGEE